MQDSPELSDNPTNYGDNDRLSAELNGIMQKSRNTEIENPTDVTIKPVSLDDISELETNMPFGPKNYHQERLHSQQDGKSLYLIARYGTELAGHSELIFGGPKEIEVREALKDIPEISATEVRPEVQSKGIGTQIILAAEQAAKEKGYTQVCLGVSEENPRARALYERLGYVARNLPRHSIVNSSGKTAYVDYLIKDL